MHRYNVNTLSYFVMVAMIMITWYYMPICHPSLSPFMCSCVRSFVHSFVRLKPNKWRFFACLHACLFVSTFVRLYILFWLHYSHFNFISSYHILQIHQKYDYKASPVHVLKIHFYRYLSDALHTKCICICIGLTIKSQSNYLCV